MNPEPSILYKAPWVVPIVSPVIRDGGVLARGGRIEAVGRFAELRRGADRIVAVNGALMPQHVNCHAHLELSVYGERCREALLHAPPKHFPDWIRTLLAMREKTGGAGDALAAARRLLCNMAAEGVGVVLDTGNLPESAGIGEGGPAEVVFLLEMLGMTEAAAIEKCDSLDTIGDDLWVTGHAPYSTHPVLLQGLKRRCRAQNRLFSIHTAESPEETEFLADGSGPMAEFLRERGVWDRTFDIPKLSPVSYLQKLNLLDANTLCVHCVQVNDRDLGILAASGAKVCLCPESNRTLGVGRAPVEKMLQAGLEPCLGTDSLTSNPHCSLWREMQLLNKEHPGVAPSGILVAATLNGAKALGLENRIGALAAGREARMLAVEQDCGNEKELQSYLVGGGQQVRSERIGMIHG